LKHNQPLLLMGIQASCCQLLQTKAAVAAQMAAAALSNDQTQQW
jgi:hypothetical protein